MDFTDRIGGALGWLGGVATVYGPVSLGTVGAVWAVSRLVRYAGGRLIGALAA